MLKQEWLVRKEGKCVHVPFICNNVLEYADNNELTIDEVESLKYLIHQNRDLARCYISDQELMYDMLRMAYKLEVAINKHI
nr:MAG TPA: hypothetical protein [Caudoviricetes sp.]